MKLKENYQKNKTAPTYNTIDKKTSDRITISIPKQYKYLIEELIRWLDGSDYKGSKYKTLKNLSKSQYTNENYNHKYHIEEDEILKPIVFFRGYPMTRSVMQILVDDHNFIYSPTALVEFLINLGEIKNTKGNAPSYNQVGKWNLNYHGRNFEISKNYEFSVKYEKLKQNRRAVKFCQKNRELIHKFLLESLRKTYKE